MRLIDTSQAALEITTGADAPAGGTHVARLDQERTAQPAAEQPAPAQDKDAAAEARFQELLKKASNGPEMGYGWGTSGRIRVSGGGWGDR